MTTPLAHNIKVIRKHLGLSQEGLAEELGIKRSNVAAYESKNVEPRLRIILEMSKLFKISVQKLIESHIQPEEIYHLQSEHVESESTIPNQTLEIQDNRVLDEFIEKSIKIRKVLEGFKSFYNFKKEQFKNPNNKESKTMFDIENFLQLMEHLLYYNESVIKTVQAIR